MTKEQEKELAAWKKLRKYFKKYFIYSNYTGLCKLLNDMQVNFTLFEYQFLIEEIQRDAKKNGTPSRYSEDFYWLFKPKSAGPRLKYLQVKIKSYENT